MKVQADGTYKVTVKMTRRPDGGLRAWSDEIPGLVLSHRDPELVLRDITPALTVMLSDMLGAPVEVHRLSPLPVFGPHITIKSRLNDALVLMREKALLAFNITTTSELEFATHAHS